jgi:AcrR family transcriptional regulator
MRRLKDAGWSKYDLAKRAAERGVSRTAVYEWLAGKRDLVVSSLDVILNLLRMDCIEAGALPAPTAAKPGPKPRKKH